MAERKSADIRKSEIVLAMLRLADELGPDRLTTLALARAIGVTQPAIFRHFSTKQDLWLAVAEHISGKMTLEWDGVLESSKLPQDRLVGLMQVQLHQISNHPAIPAILHSRELHVENAALRLKFTGLITQFQTLLVEELSKGVAQGFFRADLVPRDAAILLISLVQGLAIRWSLGQRSFSLQTEGDRIVRSQINLFQPQMQNSENR